MPENQIITPAKSLTTPTNIDANVKSRTSRYIKGIICELGFMTHQENEIIEHYKTQWSYLCVT